MPLYEYECRSCGIKIEKLESMAAPREQDCGTCQKKLGLRRITSLTSFALSGDAWYAGGYSREDQRPSSPPTAAPTPTTPEASSPSSPPATPSSTAPPTPVAPPAPSKDPKS
ncbi:MAG: FmdB family zinc ribbon protein [Holophagaceae bacterium]